MHKKPEEELFELARSILGMKNENEAVVLKEKARELYEKLLVLVYLEKEKANQPVPENTPAQPIHSEPKESFIKREEPEENTEDEDLFEPRFDSVRIDIESLRSNQVSSKEEFRDSVSADKTATLFDNLEKSANERKTLNDRFLKGKIQIGLNDRLAFVKHLFNNDQSDFNAVLNNLNNFETELQAKQYIDQNLKNKYNWEGKEAYEERFLTLIERKFS
ncbi:MAG: hypothetical protein KDC69_04085 [Flavobacteriaceae bacterium]|nr:hypothetical protein [Flavobacteriaceae bacterium]